MTLSLADEIRANTAAIVAQLRGFSKQPPHLQKVTLPAPFFSQIADRMEALQAEVNAPKPCAECGTHSNLFEPRDRDDGKFAKHTFARIAACVADEKRLFEETGALTAAGKSDGLDRAINATKGCL